MTSITSIDDFRAALTARLPDAAVEITAAREPGRRNVWVVGEGASEVVEDLLEGADSAVHDSLNSVQVFESEEEAERIGVRLAPTDIGRLDWPTRANPDIYADQLALDFELRDPSFERPIVVSFYSFRGGVGRSTALAHTAAALAARGRRVLVVDADLEAPGIHHVFGISPSAARSATPLVTLLAELQRDSEPPSDYDLREYITAAPGFDNLFILAAGEPSLEYLTTLNELQIRAWTIEKSNPVVELVNVFTGSDLDLDVVLIDARTGFTDTNAAFLLGASDHAVLVFYPSLQSRAGNELVVTTLRQTLGRHGAPLGLHFIASPLPAGPGEKTSPELELRARTWAALWTYAGEGDVEDPDFVAIPYASALALTDRMTDDPSLGEPYTRVADWIDPGEREATDRSEPSVVDVRRELEFSAGDSDNTSEDIRRLFVRTDDAARVLARKILLVEGRKGTGKTTLFRWLNEEQGALPITVPERLRDRDWWPTHDVWRAVERIDPSFAVAWPLFIALRVLEQTEIEHESGERLLGLAQGAGVPGLRDGVKCLQDDSDDAVLVAVGIMVDVLAKLPQGTRLTFDGLDTVFGYTAEDQELRDSAIRALLPLLLDREAASPTVVFTVFLRTDIVRNITFANQSHLFGRRLSLSWDKEEYLKTILKQAIGSSRSFATYVDASADSVDDMTEDQTLRVWYELVGIRVRGKQTQFTDRWIWSRLADGNGDHSPRHLAQFFGALSLRARSRAADVAPPPLRARDFGAALSDTVSAEALTAIRDEFGAAVEGLIPIFAEIEESPFDTSQWSGAGGTADSLMLAHTVGLVGDHPRERGRLVVPELYRYALKVRRRGPA